MRTIANKGICLCLSFLLASGVLLSGLACPRQAHAVVPALAIPAGAAAMGVTAENALVAFGMIMAATTGVSLQQRVGADKQLPPPAWTEEQLKQGFDDLGTYIDFLKKYFPNYGEPEWKVMQSEVKTEKPPKNSDGSDPSNNPDDYDGNPFWWLVGCIVAGNVAADSLSSFVEGTLDYLLENPAGSEGPLWLDTTSYPNLKIYVNGKALSIPVSSSSDVTFDNRNYGYCGERLAYGWDSSTSSYTETRSIYRRNSNGTTTPASYVGATDHISFTTLEFVPGLNLFLEVKDSEVLANGVGSSSSTYIDVPNPGYKSSGHYTSIGYDYAKLIDPSYLTETSTTFNEGYQLADTPDTITNGTSEKKAAPAVSYLNDFSTVSNSSPKEYHVTAPVGSSLPSNWNDIFTVTTTEPKPSTDTQPDTPTPSPGGGIDTPEDYKFPDSWSELGFNRVFPFFFFDDLYRLADSWLSADEYNPKFSITISPSFWGAKTGDDVTLTVDATSLERYRQFVRGVFLALTFVGLVARMYEWWSGGSTRAERDE